jgi:hypothetical protein
MDPAQTRAYQTVARSFFSNPASYSGESISVLASGVSLLRKACFHSNLLLCSSAGQKSVPNKALQEQYQDSTISVAAGAFNKTLHHIRQQVGAPFINSFPEPVAQGSCKLQSLHKLLNRFSGSKLVILVESFEEHTIVQQMLNSMSVQYLSAVLQVEDWDYDWHFSSSRLQYANSRMMDRLVAHTAVEEFNSPASPCSVLLCTKHVFEAPNLAPHQADAVVILSGDWICRTTIKECFRLRLYSAGPTGAPLTVVRVVAAHTVEDIMTRKNCTFVQLQGASVDHLAQHPPNSSNPFLHGLTVLSEPLPENKSFLWQAPILVSTVSKVNNAAAPLLDMHSSSCSGHHLDAASGMTPFPNSQLGVTNNLETDGVGKQKLRAKASVEAWVSVLSKSLLSFEKDYFSKNGAVQFCPMKVPQEFLNSCCYGEDLHDRKAPAASKEDVCTEVSNSKQEFVEVLKYNLELFCFTSMVSAYLSERNQYRDACICREQLFNYRIINLAIPQWVGLVENVDCMKSVGELETPVRANGYDARRLREVGVGCTVSEKRFDSLVVQCIPGVTSDASSCGMHSFFVFRELQRVLRRKGIESDFTFYVNPLQSAHCYDTAPPHASSSLAVPPPGPALAAASCCSTAVIKYMPASSGRSAGGSSTSRNKPRRPRPSARKSRAGGPSGDGGDDEKNAMTDELNAFDTETAADNLQEEELKTPREPSLKEDPEAQPENGLSKVVDLATEKG